MAKLGCWIFGTTWRGRNAKVAHDLAKEGFVVFPCRSADSGQFKAKSPYVRWRHRTPMSVDAVMREWCKFPDAIPGIHAGASNRLVIDPDAPKNDGDPDGRQAWTVLVAQHSLPNTPKIDTPGGGWHFWFRQPAGRQLGNREGKLTDGINVRGVGGYVIAPGAVLPDGREYKLADGSPPLSEAPEPPAWLVEMIEGEAGEVEPAPVDMTAARMEISSNYAYAALESEISALASTRKGGRNNALNIAALRLYGLVFQGALDQVTVDTALVNACHSNGLIKDKGLPAFRATCRSAHTAAKQKPRQAATPRVTVEGGFGSYAPPAARAPAEPSDIVVTQAGDLLRRPAPERKWLVRDWIPHGEVTLLAGDGGIGKSTLVLQLAAAAATGTQWLGMDVTKTRVLMLSAEDDENEIHYRLEKILEGLPGDKEKNRQALNDVWLLDATGDLDPTLATYSDAAGIRPTGVFKRIVTFLRQNEIGLLILDSAADMFSEELKRHAVRSFLRQLKRIGCTVVLLGHPSADGMKTGRGYSGSTHWNNGVRQRILMALAVTDTGAVPDLDLRILTAAKSNRARAGENVLMRWAETGFARDDAAQESITKGRQAEAQTIFVKLLRRFCAEQRPPSPSCNQYYAPKLFAEHPDAGGFSKEEFSIAMDNLLGAGKIEIVEEGPPSKLCKRLRAAPSTGDLFDQESPF